MTSGLRNQTPIFAAPAVTSTRRYSSPPPAKKQKKMTVTQTYYLAHTARGKLSSEASRGDHDLRLLVGHANLLDNLMVELHEAEREQEAWFNQTIRNQRTEEEPQRVQWSDKMATVAEEDEDMDSDSDDEEIDAEEMLVPIRRLRSPPVQISSIDIDDDDYDEDAEGEFDDDFAKHDLALVRTASHSSPPELVADASDSDDDEEPSSPPQPTLDNDQIFAITESKKEQSQESKQPLVTEQSLLEDGFYLPERQQPIIAAC